MRIPVKRKLPIGIAIMLIAFLSAATGHAAEVTLAWEPNENSNLIGYNLYYKAGSSVQADTNEANLVYIPLSDPNFDPSTPTYTVSDLEADTEYFFYVSAMIDDEESGMSNEVSSITGDIPPSPRSASGNESSGCFIGTLR